MSFDPQANHPEDTLLKSGVTFRHLLDAAPDAMIIIDEAGLIVLINAEGQKLFGYRREELQGQPVELLMPERFRGRHSHHRQGFYNRPGVRPMGTGLELSGRRKDGSEFPVEISLSPLQTNEGMLVVSAIRDVTQRKRTEAALRESEARLALVFNSTSDLQLLLRVEPDNRFVTETINRAFIENVKANTGKDAMDFVGMDYGELQAAVGLTAEEIESRRSLFQRAIEGRVTVRFETPLTPLRDALEIAVSPVVDQNGHCTHLLWNGRKVTERVKAEAALRESEERYALVTQATRDGIFDWNLVTGYSYHSPRYKEILGFRDDELPNDPSSFFGRVHPEDSPRMNQMAARHAQDRTVDAFVEEVRLRCKDGSYRWVVTRGRMVRDAEGNRTRIVGSIHDITERKGAEDALAFLASIVQSSDDSIVGSDMEGTILSWNAGSERFWGYAAEEAIGKHISFIFPREQLQEYGNINERIKRDERIERFESLRVRKGGTPVAVSVILSPIKDAHGKLLGVSAIYRDITKRKEADAQLLVAKQVAEVASRAKSEFLANMSHEIRTPMNGIIGLTEVVLESELDPEQREYLSMVKTSADLLLKIISDILDISKIQAGKFVLQPKEFWLRDLFNHSINEFTNAAREKNLRLTCHIQPEIPDVMLGDPGCLRQVLMNLLENAIKLTAAGEVVVTVETASESPDTLHFSVRDTGIGIAPDKQHMIFEPFSQVDGTSRREFGGTGLGLAISAQLIEMMGGNIWVVSDGRTGSTFHFTARLETVLTSTETASHSAKQPAEAGGTQQIDSVSEERRSVPRFASDDTASLKVLRPLSPVQSEVRVLNVSRDGLKLRADQSVEPGTLVQIHLKDEIAVAEVRYCLRVGAGFHVGIQFQNVFN